MATLTLIVVIIVIVGNLAILYLPFDKNKKVKLVWIPVGVFMVFCLLQNPENNKIPMVVQEKMQKNPEAQKAMMATFNISEEKLNKEQEMPTPIEMGVSVVLVFALIFTPLLIQVVKSNDDETKKKFEKIALILNGVACVLLLSLYYGLELGLLLYHKKSEKGKTAPVLTKRANPA